MDSTYMYRALALAKLGTGYTNPNPLVGAVIVKNDSIIGEGYHRLYGGPHAEINAFSNATESVGGATMYVTLEPCSHYGKTPPCAEAIVKKGIKKVIIAMKDPNPLVAGKGIQILKDAGIEVITGILEHQAKKLNEVFIKHITTGLPFCVLKTAMTLDGKIAAATGESKWITDETSRKYVHLLRHQYPTIMVGIGTVLADDPLLTTRLEGMQGRNPVRIVLDTHGKIPLESNILKCDTHKKTIVAVTELADSKKIKSIEAAGAGVLMAPVKNNQVNLNYVMEWLGKNKFDSVLLEGGSTLNYTALQEGIVDKIITFIAPKILGGTTAKTPVGGTGAAHICDAFLLENMEFFKLDNDLMVEAYIRKEVL
ncbi:bifunctional diaminohydroxyphosphoribosylaminopyrimidine deaminase/5-amino-6-(5-phosphoribosylamino)uracil reductase RibD [Geosporobacter ferrireducens]|uniref:bifunctional diaminohydroxyphosphoribosylaminopyrimidine deaminase/5-amino-6-(5-phosphoribosylamino)uracil reductase RibD n=1 Tax=Geosporobacter ferrireducens TaxID=1424294 RepID=UPI00139E1E02|nr:bifunctional diaminohydroxyphosphoribosylaminopyrimidine deaminase/5-amino-6-(5-phosphoribosylamino)uracil reductase RibD [Geosporobacter ferrireducens]MTI55422.1 bifunctional diaminohydroxyphosphoribosylaminopyrimidine deaminase/5-amino-6-(5-phosphoribosylamino)uracil reductase RibD [Geosporobacter ferrireducens]